MVFKKCYCNQLSLIIDFVLFVFFKYKVRMILYSNVIKSFWCVLLWFINISLLSSLRRRWFHLLSWLLRFCQESSHVFFWWDSATISLEGFDSNILVRFCGDSLWAAFHSNILVRLDSNFFLISSGSNILVSFGTNFLWAAVATISGVTIIYLV